MGYKLNEIEEKAKSILDASIYDFIAGGAGSEWGVQNNNNAYHGYQIVPRALQNVGSVDTAINILGSKISTPVIIAPCAFHKLVHFDGELATAAGVAKFGTIMTLSTMATVSIEDVSKVEKDSPKWFQLYVYKNRQITEELVRRAEESGYKAIVVTVDVPCMGIRFRDIKNKFSLPSHMEAANFKKFGLSDLSKKTEGSKIKDYTDAQFDASLTWEAVDWLRTITSLPILVKGILHPEDAKEAVKHNVDGIIVSNHGGRQIDNVVASIDALTPILNAIHDKVPVILDGGIRCGEDIFKALALGANAVMLSRPILWALAIGGANEVASTLNNLKEELIAIMRLSGCQNIQRIRENGISLLAGPSVEKMRLMELEVKIKQFLEENKLNSASPQSSFQKFPRKFV